jgi:hypothetical protein
VGWRGLLAINFFHNNSALFVPLCLRGLTRRCALADEAQAAVGYSKGRGTISTKKFVVTL